MQTVSRHVGSPVERTPQGCHKEAACKQCPGMRGPPCHSGGDVVPKEQMLSRFVPDNSLAPLLACGGTPLHHDEPPKF